MSREEIRAGGAPTEMRNESSPGEVGPRLPPAQALGKGYRKIFGRIRKKGGSY